MCRRVDGPMVPPADEGLVTVDRGGREVLAGVDLATAMPVRGRVMPQTDAGPRDGDLKDGGLLDLVMPKPCWTG